MKKLPYGISNYEELVTQNYYYVDKTEYIEKLENLAEKRIMFLRPRKFGKTLFTSTLEYYYDINQKENFKKLYGETYIGKNPTSLKNSYHILKFNFSGIDTTNMEGTIKGFREKVDLGINRFVNDYNLNFYNNPEQSTEGALGSLFEAFRMQNKGEKIYVIIDEYDHFANELLGFRTDDFKDLVAKNGKIRKWYEVLKEGTESVVERIFITGVAPITLDSLTSGFNICSDKTMDRSFNEMLGFTKNELVEMMEKQEITQKEQGKLLPVLKENYDGYKFSIKSIEQMYNSNMSLYFLNEYMKYKEPPEKMIDMNIASDYKKLGNMLDLCKGDNKLDILEKTVSGEGIAVDIVEKFNPEMEFGDREFASMLFYLGYLTIKGEEYGYPLLVIPNSIMRDIYSDYFLKIVGQGMDEISGSNFIQISKEIAEYGKIDEIMNMLHKYLNNLSNRDFQRFDEKYVKLIAYCIAMNLKQFSVKSEMEVNRRYPDLIIMPRDRSMDYRSVMIEFKYLKKEDAGMLEEKKEEARKQIFEYSEFEDIKAIKGLSKYVVVAVVDEIFVEKID